MIYNNQKPLPTEELSPLIAELTKQGTDVTLTVTGNSMKPMLTHLRDSVLLTKCNPDKLKVGDITLYKRENGRYILHRILKVHEDTFDFAGDHQIELETGIKKSQVLCVVKGFTHKGKFHSCKELKYRLYALVWRALFPFRGYIMRLYRKLHSIFRK